MARTDILDTNVKLGLTLDRYAELMLLPEAAFNGLSKPEDVPEYYCTTIWQQHDRDNLAMYIAMAEETREEELGYHISKKYLDEYLPYGNPVTLKRAHIDRIGEKTTSVISAGEAVALTSDPISITVATAVTDTEEIKIFYPGEDVLINPSSVEISGGNATIKIPRSRLVKPELNDNREDALKYADDSNFLATVDIKRVYYNESEGCEYIWLDVATYNTLTQTARPIIENAELGIIKPFAASYSDGAWIAKGFTYGAYPYQVRVKYLSGIESSQRTEILTAKLAHTMMPFKPIDCEAVTQYWTKDLAINPRKIMTPYGASMGAVECWVFDSRKKQGMGGMF